MDPDVIVCEASYYLFTYVSDALTNIFGEISMNPVTERTNYVSKEP